MAQASSSSECQELAWRTCSKELAPTKCRAHHAKDPECVWLGPSCCFRVAEKHGWGLNGPAPSSSDPGSPQRRARFPASERSAPAATPLWPSAIEIAQRHYLHCPDAPVCSFSGMPAAPAGARMPPETKPRCSIPSP